MLRGSIFIVVLLVLLALLAAAFAATSAGSTVGSFEIDGNLQDDSGPGEPIDWASPPPNLTDFTDPTGQTDDSFGQGSKELEPGDWACIINSVPGKDDIVNGAVAIRSLGTKRFLYVNFERLTVNGDAHMDYEFNQSNEPNPACPELPRRTAGDVLITFDTENGGRTILVRAFVWQGTTQVGTFEELPLGSQGAIWDGAINIPSTIPGVEAGAFGEAVIDLTDSPIQLLCPEFVYMKTRASTSINAELKDRTALQPVNFQDRPDLANAHGSAFGARVTDTLLGLDQTLGSVSSSQAGVGSNSQSGQVLDVNIPEPTGEVLRADVVRTSSTSTVTNSPAEAKDTGVAETANVNILDGLVTASHVRGVAATTASGSASSFSSSGSAFQDLVVSGVAVNDVTPNTRIDLPAAVYGPESYVLLYERVGSISAPDPGQIQGGAYTADLTVNMIRVHITDKLPLVEGDQTLDVIVSNAVAHADFPQRELCGVPPEQTVSGHAFITSAATDPSVLPMFGFVSIPATGGLDHQDLDEVSIGSAVTAGASVSESSGALSATASSASSYSEAANICLLWTGLDCTISATAVRSQSISSADASGASSNAAGTELVGLGVGSQTFSASPPPNTVITLPGIGFVIVNEQFADAQAAGHSGLTVRAVHVVVTMPGNPFGLAAGAEIIIAEAHSDATFR